MKKEKISKLYNYLKHLLKNKKLISYLDDQKFNIYYYFKLPLRHFKQTF